MAQTNLKIWRESASLILVAKSIFFSSSEFNYKLLCLQRSSNSKVLANTYVFPGGKISKSDISPSWIKLFEKVGYPLKSLKKLYPKENVPPIVLNETKDCLPKYLSLRICAIRETFEECGILICRNNKTSHDHKGEKAAWATYIEGSEVRKWQKKVHNNPDQFLNMCTQLDIHPDVWSLHDWSNWMTPPELHHRFDTMFFITSLSQMPSIQHDVKEIQNVRWAFPDEFIKEHLNQKIRLSIPQFYEISRLRNFAKIDDLSKYGAERSSYGCETYFPYRVAAKEGVYSVFPGDDLYPENSEKVDRDITILDDIPQSNIQNRLLSRGEYPVRLYLKNVVPKDKHLPPKI